MDSLTPTAFSTDLLKFLESKASDYLSLTTVNEMLADYAASKITPPVLPSNWKFVDNNLTVSFSSSDSGYLELFTKIKGLQQNLSETSFELSLHYDSTNYTTLCLKNINESLVHELANSNVKQEEEVKSKIELAVMEEPMRIEYEGTINCLSNDIDNKYKVKIPIAKIGNWKHPVYGDLSYSEETLRELQANVEKGAAGFEPPLFIGHPRDTEGGAAAEGYLEKTERVGEVLYGVWSVNSKVYRDIEDGKYRYSSSEFITKFKDKKTGNSIGIVLVGMALTNRPFIPNLPKVVTLSEMNIPKDNISMVTFDYNGYNNVNIIDNQVKERIMSDEIKNEVPAPVRAAEEQDYKQMFKAELDEHVRLVENTYKQQLSEVVHQNQILQDKIAKFEKAAEQQELERKLNFINSLGLPKETKDEYSLLVTEGKLGEAEETVLNSLRKLADTMAGAVLLQHGYSVETENMNSVDYDDPYRDVVEYNQKLASSLKSSIR
jgi:hypothetical protein